VEFGGKAVCEPGQDVSHQGCVVTGASEFPAIAAQPLTDKSGERSSVETSHMPRSVLTCRVALGALRRAAHGPLGSTAAAAAKTQCSRRVACPSRHWTAASLPKLLGFAMPGQGQSSLVAGAGSRAADRCDSYLAGKQ
jgi:hypothetical protein